MSRTGFWLLSITLITSSYAVAIEPPELAAYSGIYPHLAYFNDEGECGTGAVVPFADRLWVITYGPHLPKGSADKLYEINNQLQPTIRKESIGGTPANRMLHRESNQLFIGPYAIDGQRNVRTIPYASMFGRLTANMRHLTDPSGKVYYATMEEGFYEVNVNSLSVAELYKDGNAQSSDLGGTLLPGYHGKGAYTGQGVVVYANNGERGAEALKRPDVPSGVLAEWNGKDWKVIRRNQFTEVTGPGGLYGNTDAEADPIWSIGWDHRSLILMLRDQGSWHAYRLPKASHTYDGAHGWNTEWPRIREIGEGNDLLMTMHGTFWHFPKTFSVANSAGIAPRSTYLKVVGDFCRWNDRLVFGCDDTAKSEFLNKRKAKGDIAGPGQSQSNLWFTSLQIFDELGPALGRGAVWLNDSVKAHQWSEPYLMAGYARRSLILSHHSDYEMEFEMQVDNLGNGTWELLQTITIPAHGNQWIEFPANQQAQWIRLRPSHDAEKVTAFFHYSNSDNRPTQASPIFDGFAPASSPESIGGFVRARGENKRTLAVVATVNKPDSIEESGYYELDAAMKLRRVQDSGAMEYTRKNTTIPRRVLSVDSASVIYVDDNGQRWRLPKGQAHFDSLTEKGFYRIDREVVTERDLFNAHGTFYELPADNAGGFIKVRPIATHNCRIHDYCSYRGLVILTGIEAGTQISQNNSHIIRSDDGKAAVWAGTVDDLWKLGKSVGVGGPWKNSTVQARMPSDPYLMTGYDKKSLTLSSNNSVNISVEVDFTGDGTFTAYRSFEVESGKMQRHDFPTAFAGYWVRVVADKDCVATAEFEYQ